MIGRDPFAVDPIITVTINNEDHHLKKINPTWIERRSDESDQTRLTLLTLLFFFASLVVTMVVSLCFINSSSQRL